MPCTTYCRHTVFLHITICTMKPLLVLALLLCYTSGPAQEPAEWKHYDLFSAGIDLPGFLVRSSTDEYKTTWFSSPVSKSISLSVMCLIPDARFTPAGLDDYHSDTYHFFDTVVYDYIKKDFFVVSGLDRQGNILYIKGIKKGASYFEMDLSYSKKYQHLFDKTLSKMSASFK